MRRLLLPALLALLVAACATPEPVTQPPPEPPPPAQTPPAPEPEPAPPPEPPAPVEEPEEPEPEPEPDPLYERTEDELRLAFTDGLFSLYRADVNPAAARRLSRAEVDSWLTDLSLSSPRAVAFAREVLGPVLQQRYLVGFVIADANPAECASVRDVLYVPVPERFQGPDRPFTGFLVQDTCDVGEGELCRFCAGGFGVSESGAACSCICTAGACPGIRCVEC